MEVKVPHGFTCRVLRHKHVWVMYQSVLAPGVVNRRKKWLFWILSMEAAALKMSKENLKCPGKQLVAWVTNLWPHSLLQQRSGCECICSRLLHWLLGLLAMSTKVRVSSTELSASPAVDNLDCIFMSTIKQEKYLVSLLGLSKHYGILDCFLLRAMSRRDASPTGNALRKLIFASWL